MRTLSGASPIPREDAATIAEARAIDLKDEISRLKREQDELEDEASRTA